MDIHWVNNCVVPPPGSLSGADRIMVECVRRWSPGHSISVYGWEGARQLCEHQKLTHVNHVLWSSAKYQKYGLPIHFASEALIGLKESQKITFDVSNPNLFISASDLLPDSLPVLSWKMRYPKVPLVAAFYLFAPPWTDLLSGKPGPGVLFTLYRPFQQWVLRRILKLADLILVTGEEDRERMIKLGRKPESVFAVRGGVDLLIPKLVPEPSQKDYDAVFIGRFHPQKGVREILEIWSKVVRFKPNARLAMIGKGPLERELKVKVDQLGLAKQVYFAGFQDGVDKYKIIKASRIVVHPAIYDSGGMAPAEALACGLPGVAFDLDSLKSYYPRGFLKAPRGDLNTFATLICKLLESENEYQRMSKEASAVGLEWDWDIRAKQIFQAIENILNVTK